MAKTIKTLNLAAWRKRVGLTQQDIAEYLDVAKATVSRYETGQFPITVEVLNAYLLAINTALEGLEARQITLDDLVEYEEDVRRSPSSLSLENVMT